MHLSKRATASWSIALAFSTAACSSDDPIQARPGASEESGGSTGSGGKQSSGSGGSGGSAAGATGSGGTNAGSGGISTGYGGGGAGGTVADAGGDACVSETLTVPPGIPESLVPHGATLVHFLHAVGTQTYTCVVNPVEDGGVATYDWGGSTHASTPEAQVYDNCGVAKVHHYAGPTWEWIKDGSAIKGQKIAGVAMPGTIPWLLLKTSVVTGGKLGDVTFVQRLETVGGAPPATGCDAAHVGATVSVDYTAGYYFYTGPTDGG